ncbi:MAG: glutamate--tRNA ligase [Thermoanaerobaculia bacterium]|nr:glutamate--tRNA ligase [Thermoanaerobaculia bacterium]
MPGPIRTRFAPSPTGYLHIGGVRTALFNWLFARGRGGAFVLRIDDTDVERNLEEALQPIVDGLRWLGVDWDEGPGAGGDHGPYFQSQRADSHRAAAARLVERGHAYWDYATPEELAAERETARTQGRRFLYSRRFRAETPADRERFEAEGRSGVVRLLMPREGTCRFTDAVRGEVEVEWAAEQDHVIQRGDGSCLYHLASAVDDHQMAISHVIRAEEHLSNTPRQIFIMESLGYELPVFAHLPFVAEPGSSKKLSKRKLARYLQHDDFRALAERGESIARTAGIEVDDTFNPVIVDFYRKVGFLPEALVNYLALLGWSLDDKTEDFTPDELVQSFSLERVNRAPASLDPQKLLVFQGRHMAARPVEERVELTLPFLRLAELVAEPPSEAEVDRLRRVVEAAGDRIVVAGDILDYADFFLPDHELPYDEKAFEKRLVKPEEAGDLLRRFRIELGEVEAFDAVALERGMRAFTEARGIKLGQIIHAVRVAVTGKAVGFGMFETLEILGRESCLARIDRALAELEARR